MMKRQVLAAVAAVFVLAVVANGQMPVIESLYIPLLPPGLETADEVATDFVDMPGTQATVILPPGEIVIQWAVDYLVGGGGPTASRVRPAIGQIGPEEGLHGVEGTGGLGHASGSWATSVPGGTYSVKLQIRNVGIPQRVDLSGGYVNWTLIAFPEQAAGVPALGSFGFGIMVLLALCAGTVVFRRKRKPLLS